MFKFTKKLAIVASLVTLYSVQFNAFASGSESYLDDDYGEQEQSARPVSLSDNIVQDAVVSLETIHEGEVQTAFFPILTGRDMKGYLARVLCEESSPFRLAQVCKAWYQFVMGRGVVVNKDQPISVDPFSKSSTSVQEIMNRWRAQKDLQILRNGTFRYQPDGSAPIEVNLSTMLDTNGDLVLPAELAIPLCVTRMTETFVRPVGDNTRKTLVLLLTLSELKSVAGQISTDASFLQNVAKADLSQNAVCALIRYGGDALEEWGFRYAILKYREMTGLSVWQIYTHENVARGGVGRRGVTRWCSRVCLSCFVRF